MGQYYVALTLKANAETSNLKKQGQLLDKEIANYETVLTAKLNEMNWSAEEKKAIAEFQTELANQMKTSNAINEVKMKEWMRRHGYENGDNGTTLGKRKGGIANVGHFLWQELNSITDVGGALIGSGVGKITNSK